MEGIMDTNTLDTPLVNTPGRLAIKNGRVHMLKPRGYGSWPVIIPGENVEILYEDQLVTGPTVIDDVRNLKVVPASAAPASSFEIVVAPDELSVSLSVTFTPGREYQLVDADYARKLTVQAKLVRETPPTPIDPALVLQELREQNIRGEIDYEKIMQACAGLQDGEFIIARGMPPRPPVDGRVELVCEFMSRPVFPDNAQRVDFRDRMSIASVEPGDVLARWYPPQMGQPGRNVYGEVIMPRRPKLKKFKPGRGVKLVDNGRLAVAEIAGRPVYRKGILSVNQQIIVHQDVNMATGNIKFTGDVAILGDVTEGMTVESGEIVDVKGSVYHATVHAGSHIHVGKKLIGGRLAAGVMRPGFNEAALVMGRLGSDLRKAAEAHAQLKERNESKGLTQNSDGYLIKLVLEQRYPHVPAHCAWLTDFLSGLLKDEDLMRDNPDLNKQLAKALTLAQCLVACFSHPWAEN
jgi:hypothetical protein